MPERNTIVLKGKLGRRYDEARMSVAGYPGYLVEIDANDKYRPHSTRAGKTMKRFLVEDDLQGNTIDDIYNINDLGRTVVAEPGDIIQTVLHAGETVTRGDWLISYGDGTVAKAAAAFLSNVVAPSAAVTNTVAETTFSNGTVAIPKNTLAVGDVLRIRAFGSFPSTNATDTANIKLKLGAQILAQTGALDVANGDVFLIDVYLVVRTIGAAGTYTVSGYATIGTPGTATEKVVALGSTVFDTTAAITLTVTATWSVANAANQVLLDELIVEQVKAASSSAANGGMGGDVVGTAEVNLDLSASLTNDFLPVYIK